MRISDWSSDVCSSDLRSSRLFLRLASYSANGEIVAAVGALNDRLHRTRMLELEVFADAADELSELETMASERHDRSEEHTSELQSLMRISYAVFCLKKKTAHNNNIITQQNIKI